MAAFFKDDEYMQLSGSKLKLSSTYQKGHWGAKMCNIKSQCLTGWLWFYIDDVSKAKYKIRNKRHRQCYMDRAMEEFAKVEGKKYFVWKPDFIITN